MWATPPVIRIDSGCVVSLFPATSFAKYSKTDEPFPRNGNGPITPPRTGIALLGPIERRLWCPPTSGEIHDPNRTTHRDDETPLTWDVVTGGTPSILIVDV